MDKIIDINELKTCKNSKTTDDIIKTVDTFEKIINESIDLFNIEREIIHDRVLSLHHVIENQKEMKITDEELEYIYFEYSILCKLITTRINNTNRDIDELIKNYDERFQRIIK